jgi:multidrug efflux pump
LFGLFLTPLFYVLLRTFAKRFEKPAAAPAVVAVEGVAP